jgi:putative flippase GtrA
MVVTMSKRIRELLEWSKTHQGKKLIRYTLSSIITTMVSLVAILVTYGFKIIHGIIEATLFGNLIAVIPSYYLNRAWAWGKRGRSHIRNEVIPYWAMAILGIAFSLVGATLVKHLIHNHHFGHLVDTVLVAGVNLLSFAIFWILKILLFNRIFHTEKLHDIDARLSEEERTSN